MKKLILFIVMFTSVALSSSATITIQVASSKEAKEIIKQSKKEKDSVYIICMKATFISLDKMILQLMEKNKEKITTRSYFGYGHKKVESNLVIFLIFSLFLSSLLCLIFFLKRRDELSVFPAVYMFLIGILNTITLGTFYISNHFVLIMPFCFITLNILMLLVCFFYFILSIKIGQSICLLKVFTVSIIIQFFAFVFCFI